jgi:hypothetical protein
MMRRRRAPKEKGCLARRRHTHALNKQHLALNQPNNSNQSINQSINHHHHHTQHRATLHSLLSSVVRRRSSGASSYPSSSTHQPLLPTPPSSSASAASLAEPTPSHYHSMSAASGSAGAAPADKGDKGEASLALLENGAAVPVAATGTPVDGGGGSQVQQQQQRQQTDGAAWWWSKACCVHPLLVFVQFIFSGAFLVEHSESRCGGVRLVAIGSHPAPHTHSCCNHRQQRSPLHAGYHVLTSTALQSKGVNALVFALYRELSASVLIAGLAAIAVHRGGHQWRIERRHLPRFMAMVGVCARARERERATASSWYLVIRFPPPPSSPFAPHPLSLTHVRSLHAQHRGSFPRATFWGPCSP